MHLKLAHGILRRKMPYVGSDPSVVRFLLALVYDFYAVSQINCQQRLQCLLEK